MFRNYLIIGWRNLKKNKIFSVINIAGLALGIAACLLILQYVSFEFSYDQFHENKQSVYRVINDRYQQGKLTQHSTRTYSAIGRAMKEDYPNEVADYSRIIPLNRVMQYGDKKTAEDGLAADQAFLHLFSFPLLAGNRQDALKDPNSIILSEKLARKIMQANADPGSLVGQVLQLENDSFPYKITGICKNVPENSHLQFDFLVSYTTLYSGGNAYWKRADHSFKESDFWMYLQLKPGVDYKALQAKFPAFSQQHFNGSTITGSDEVFYLQPLVKTHLYSDVEFEIGKTGNVTMVWGLLVIALFTIVIAWVNYINLSTSRAAERAREVGVRKVMGALRPQLIRQFMGESIMVNGAALLLALLLVYLVQPAFNRLLGHDLSLAFLFSNNLNGYSITGSLTALLLAGIILAGFYPAFVLSSFKPVTALKGKVGNSGKGLLLRKSLVVAQFTITVCLIIGSLVVYRQVQFMNNKQLGLNIDQMLVIKPPSLSRMTDSVFFSRLNSFKEEVKQLANVKGATGSNRVPGMELTKITDVYRADDQSGAVHTINTWGVNHDFPVTYKMKLLAGRSFTLADFDLDWSKNNSVIVTASVTRLLGFPTPQSAVGQKLIIRNKPKEIIGVTDDFHHKSLHYRAEPTLLQPSYGLYNSLSVNISPANLSQTIAAIRGKYETFFPGNLFDYYFLDEKFNEQYKDDRLFGNAFGLFSALAITIACMGLFGLSLYTITRRTKEIGVRKVLGASVSTIVLLLCKEFVRLVVIASLVAFPAAWWIMHNWLNDFAYRINIGWWVFAVAGMLALLVTLATVGVHAIKAALANPVKSLRSE